MQKTVSFSLFYIKKKKMQLVESVLRENNGGKKKHSRQKKELFESHVEWTKKKITKQNVTKQVTAARWKHACKVKA